MLHARIILGHEIGDGEFVFSSRPPSSSPLSAPTFTLNEMFRVSLEKKGKGKAELSPLIPMATLMFHPIPLEQACKLPSSDPNYIDRALVRRAAAFIPTVFETLFPGERRPDVPPLLQPPPPPPLPFDPAKIDEVRSLFILLSLTASSDCPTSRLALGSTGLYHS